MKMAAQWPAYQPGGEKPANGEISNELWRKYRNELNVSRNRLAAKWQ
jgi:hypothetical protein